MKKAIEKFILSGLVLSLVSCASPDDSSSGGGGTTTSPSTSPSGPQATEAAPLALQIFTIYDDTQTVASHSFQETGSATCQATDSSPVVNCTVNIPEARLYYSTLRFAFSWRNDKCKLLIFQPYYYLHSLSATFLPPWADSAIDCSTSPTPSTCYGGAAPLLVSGFPKKRALIYLSDPSVTAPQASTLNLDSAFKKSFGSNRHSVNDINPTKKGSDFTFSNGDAYKANTYVDYQFYCQDDWADPKSYIINLYVKDVDSEGTPTINNFRTWEEIP